MKLYNYRLWCETESKWVYWWLDENEDTPILCPENTAHTIDDTKTTIVDTIDEPKINASGSMLVSNTYETPTESPFWQKWKHMAIKNEATFFDTEITDEKFLKGGKYYINNYEDVNSEEDYIECSLIDKNDVTGLFSTYGLTVGVDILELGKFVKNEYVEKYDKFIAYYGMMPLLSGLFLRVAYNSFGSVNIRFKIRFEFYK